MPVTHRTAEDEGGEESKMAGAADTEGNTVHSDEVKGDTAEHISKDEGLKAPVTSFESRTSHASADAPAKGPDVEVARCFEWRAVSGRSPGPVQAESRSVEAAYRAVARPSEADEKAREEPQ